MTLDPKAVNTTGDQGEPAGPPRSRQGWLWRAVTPWVQRWLRTHSASVSSGAVRPAAERILAGPRYLDRFTRSIAHRFSPERGKRGQTGRERRPRLVLAGLKDIPAESEAGSDWLEAMPSFDEIRRSIEAARSGTPVSPGQPATRPEAPQPARQAPPKGGDSWLEAMPSFEEIHRAVQAAQERASRSTVAPAGVAPVKPAAPARPEVGARPGGRTLSGRTALARRIVSRVEEITPGLDSGLNPAVPPADRPGSGAGQPPELSLSSVQTGPAGTEASAAPVEREPVSTPASPDPVKPLPTDWPEPLPSPAGDTAPTPAPVQFEKRYSKKPGGVSPSPPVPLPEGDRARANPRSSLSTPEPQAGPSTGQVSLADIAAAAGSAPVSEVPRSVAVPPVKAPVAPGAPERAPASAPVPSPSSPAPTGRAPSAASGLPQAQASRRQQGETKEAGRDSSGPVAAGEGSPAAGPPPASPGQETSASAAATGGWESPVAAGREQTFTSEPAPPTLPLAAQWQPAADREAAGPAQNQPAVTSGVKKPEPARAPENRPTAGRVSAEPAGTPPPEAGRVTATVLAVRPPHIEARPATGQPAGRVPADGEDVPGQKATDRPPVQPHLSQAAPPAGQAGPRDSARPPLKGNPPAARIESRPAPSLPVRPAPAQGQQRGPAEPRLRQPGPQRIGRPTARPRLPLRMPLKAASISHTPPAAGPAGQPVASTAPPPQAPAAPAVQRQVEIPAGRQLPAPVPPAQGVEAATPPAPAASQGGGPDLDQLARQVYPIIKRMVAVERERRALS